MNHDVGGLLGSGAPANHDVHLTQLLRKLFRRAYREFQLKVPPKLRMLIPVALLAMIFAAFLTPKHVSNDLFSGLRLSDNECKCPVYGDTAYLQNHLAKARTIFKAKAHYSSKDKKLLIVSVEEVYRGPPRLADFRVALPIASVKSCEAFNVPKELEGENAEDDRFLVAADLVSGRSLVQRQQHDSSSRLYFGMAHPLECGGIIVIPWPALAWEVQDLLASEGSYMGDSWWRYDEGDKKNSTLRLMESEWFLQSGTSLVTVCRDQKETLLRAVRSWLAADNVDEIVIVDWSSRISVFEIISLYAPEILNDKRLQIVTVTGQAVYRESAAGNVGIRYATYHQVLRVNCDTVLPSDFIARHPFRANVIYRPPTTSEEFLVKDKNLIGLLFARRLDLLAVNGYDERIDSYGFADVDLAERVSAQRPLRAIPITDKIESAPAGKDDADVRVFTVMKPSDPYALEVEMSRNRFLATRMQAPPWGFWSRHMLFNSKTKFVQPNSVGTDKDTDYIRVYELSAANTAPSFADSVGQAGTDMASSRALRHVLQRIGAPTVISKTYSQQFLTELLKYEAEPENYATVLVKLMGGCASRALSLASLRVALKITSETAQVPIRYRVLWEKDADCSCKFTAMFSRADEEVFESALVKSGVNKELIFPEDAVYENITSYDNLVKKRFVRGKVSRLALNCISPRENSSIDKVRTELATFLPPDDTKWHGAASREEFKIWQDLSGSSQLDKSFLRTWQGSQTEEELSKSLQRLKDAGKIAVSVKTYLFKGCDYNTLEENLLSTFPETTVIFASLLNPLARCLSPRTRT
mmetsp:Transcript_10203/g.31179  ORF Transcript_10203/g.31179 Transcript_10203/m.31179 type:complete len:812 (+) Transcript_10203:214-2649(+)|eukprot:CAMPEP_0198734774 /NCGR_PEP_ID=MMETSP1475-20131203/55181_1 /TAXON_ID= ORGANISM="Unidentified sp., Strain CCMP1999" /NCGR_SAMPLE_ID=MMETSP1475 /ASSEMBLY_ACC=CAM_ASM_001111 /LENGTH=811 /DNA_ID=CAMNT_0044498317 /DNA_START=177 /DNA_END=2612 /DNA_ORIENTATION=-